jgi:DNA-binding MarR family transcriptional regulator
MRASSEDVASGAEAGSQDEAPAAADELDQSRLTHLLGYASSRVSITMRRVFLKHLGPLDLKVVEYSILVLVASNPQVNQRQLGETLDISAPNMAVTLDRLVERGWVERVRGTRDRRAMHIHLTPSGQDLVRRAEKIASTMENSSLRVLSPAEKALLIELLMKVATGKPRRGATSLAPARRGTRA